MALCKTGTAAKNNDDFEYALRKGQESAAELHREYGAEIGSTSTIKTHRRKECGCYQTENKAHTENLVVSAGEAGGEFEGIVTTKPLQPSEYAGAFAKVFELAGLTPGEYEIVGDSVRFSSWQQSARAKDGTRDVVTLYSYRAQFRRISAVDKATSDRIEALARKVEAQRNAAPKVQDQDQDQDLTDVAYTTLWADWQLGEQNMEATVERVMTDVSRARIETSVNKYSEALVCFMGDAIENVSDSYPNQQYTVQANLTDQLLLALDLMERVISAHLANVPKVHVLGVLCNHGQLTRKNTKTNVTDDADNAQNLLLRLLRDRVFAGDERIEWHLPPDNGNGMITTATVSGINVAAAHGHKITGREDAWLLKQTANLTATTGITPRVWLTAHRHSFNVLDLGSVSRIQAATNDNGSKHFTDATGVYSTPGTVRLLVGGHDVRGWSGADLLR